jgi:hypothetical protein
MRFRGILRGGDVAKLTVWLHDADRSTLYGIRRFVHTLRLDLPGPAITGGSCRPQRRRLS